MPTHDVEILLVEDNPSDVSCALPFQKNNIANRVEVVRDAAEALEFIFCTDRYANRQIENGPKVILLDLKSPSWTASKCSEASRLTREQRQFP